MALVTLRPDGVLVDQAAWVRSGGTTKEGVLSDDVDGTFLSGGVDDSNSRIRLSLSGYTLLADERIKAARVRARASIDGTSLKVRTATPSGSGPAITSWAGTDPPVPVRDYEGPYNTTPFSVADQQSVLTSLQVEMWGQLAEGNRVAELYVDLDVWKAPPAPTVSAPTSPVTDTDQPVVDWTAATTYGDPGVNGHVVQHRLFTALEYTPGESGWDPATAASSQQIDLFNQAGTAGTATLDPVQNDTTYHHGVRVGKQAVNGETLYGPWGFREFAVDLTLPDTPTIELVDADFIPGAVRVVVLAAPITYDRVIEFHLERSDDNGATWLTPRDGRRAVDIEPGSSRYQTFDDYEAPRGQDVQWRVTVREFLDSSQTGLNSNPSATSTLTRELDGTTNIVTVPDLLVLEDAAVLAGPTSDVVEALGVFRPPHRTGAVVVTTGVVSGDDWNLSIASDDTDHAQVAAVVGHAGQIIVQWDDGTVERLRIVRRRQTRRDLEGVHDRVWELATVAVTPDDD